MGDQTPKAHTICHSTSEDEKLCRAIKQYAPESELVVVERLEGGVSADVYRLMLLQPNGENAHVVLRIHGATHCGHSAELEFEILQALHQAGISVPKPLSFDASCSLLENPYLILAFVEGSSAIGQPMLKASIETMVEALISVHSVPVEVMPRLPRRANPVAELLDILPTDAEWNNFRTHLKNLKNIHFSGSDVVLHGDFWPSNLIWSEGRIAAILDWEDAALGDPLSDVACAGLELRYIYGKEGKVLFENAYAKYRELDLQRLALWMACTSAAALKNMGGWGLESAKESHMCKTAHDNLREAVGMFCLPDLVDEGNALSNPGPAG